MSEKQRNYEALYIVKPDLSDSDVSAIAERFKNVVLEKGGTVESAGKWDKRKLAYPVDGHKEGTYILMLFTAGSAVPAELDRLMRISDDVLRQLILVLEKPKTAEESAPKVKAPKAAAPTPEAVASVEAPVTAAAEEPVAEVAPAEVAAE